MRLLKGVFPQSFVEELRHAADKTSEDVYKDYFSNRTREEFNGIHQKESVVSRIVTFRFASTAILLRIKDYLAPQLRDFHGSREDFMLCPLFYLRFCQPGVFLSKEHEKAFLYTEPHYDTAYGVFGFSIWVPLEEINESTGGLCGFSTHVSDVVPAPLKGEKNRYNLNEYLSKAHEVDPLLKSEIVQYALKQGDALVFDPQTVHGATKPRSRRRLSFNFRFVPASQVRNASPTAKRLFDAIEKSLNLCNGINLAWLGDRLGASRVFSGLSPQEKDPRLMDIAAHFLSRSAAPGQADARWNLHWKQEYQWLAGENQDVSNVYA
ncbi:MAG: phytanoyl-CoA dioxygenase family protein [Candidatus Omnitrophica bacterium]|nr:phytanoyl-CoA dioxygenase family protein [Candidatus Omnitrophota bacterium]